MRLKALAFTSFKLPSLPLLLPLKGRLYYLLPLKGSSYSFTLNLSKAISCFSCSSIYFLMVASFSPTVLTNTLLPKNVCFQIYILNLHVYQISSAHFSLLSTPWNLTHSFLVVYSPTDVHGRASYDLLLSLHLCTYITVEIFRLCSLYTGCILFFFYTSG